MEEPKCKICGDTGRAKPTLSEPDGEECECTKEPGIMECEPHIMRSELEEDLIILKAKIELSEKVRDEKIFGEAWLNAHSYVLYLTGKKNMLEEIMARFA